MAACERALLIHERNATVQSLHAELSAGDAPASTAALAERAQARFAAGHYAAAAAAFAALAEWRGAPALERASGASNRALCFARLGDREGTLAACGQALGLLRFALAPTDALNRGAPLDPSDADALQGLLATLVAPDDKDALTSIPKASRVASTALARAAAALAHLRRFDEAAAAYKSAAELAASRGDETAADAFSQDARTVLEVASSGRDDVATPGHVQGGQERIEG